MISSTRSAIREARIPAGVAAAWKPEGRPAAVLLRWFATHWCNYRCPYCRQNHARRQPIDGHWAHCFDNWPVDRWLRAFPRHLQTRCLSLVITGGEPLVDHARMAELVNGLTAMPTVEWPSLGSGLGFGVRQVDCSRPLVVQRKI